MRKHLSLSLVLLGMATLAQAVSSGNYSNKTFLTVRPEGQTSSPEKFSGGWTIPSECMEDGCWFFGGEGRFQGVVFGGWSTKRQDTGEYFSLAQRNNQLETTAIMTVTGGVGAAGTIGTSISADINPVNLGIIFGTPGATTPGGAYSSILTFNPRRSVVGGLFDWKQYVGWWCDEPRFWFEVSFPVERVKTTMGATETDIVRSGPAVLGGSTTATVLGVLSGTQPVVLPDFAGAALTTVGTFAHGLISTDTQSRTGVADVEVKVGMDYIRDECCHLDGYIGFVAPTGTRPTGVYMFEPVVGNNHHWGIMTGGSYGCAFWHGCSDNSLRWEFETNFRYLFRNSQIRTFDLVDRPGSRYLPFFATAAAATPTPTLTLGMEVLTQSVHVKPHSQFSMTNALVYQHCGFFAEIGWNVFAREQESISPIDATSFLTNGAASIYAVADLNAYLVTGAANTVNLLSNIGNLNAGGGVLATIPGAAPLTVADVDFQSAASPAAFVNTVFGDIGYKFDWCWPIYVGVGGSYAFSANNGELNRWLAWGKFGIAF